jgi:hypothetical protein
VARFVSLARRRFVRPQGTGAGDGAGGFRKELPTFAARARRPGRAEARCGKQAACGVQLCSGLVTATGSGRFRKGCQEPYRRA